VQQSRQFVRRKRRLHVVDALETDPFRSQDPLDLATLGSGGLLIDNDLLRQLHFSLLSAAAMLLSVRVSRETLREPGPELPAMQMKSLYWLYLFL
jgi:hypothetical protein